MSLSPIHNHSYRAFSQENIRAAWDTWLNHVGQYQDKAAIPRRPQGQGLWQQRVLSHSAAAAPFVAHLPAARREISNVRQHFVTGNRQGTFESIQRLAKTARQSTKASQTAGEALRELFMANDRYHQARIEAAYKEAEAVREQNRFNWNNSVNDLLQDQEYDNLMFQCTSKRLSQHDEVCSRIIANF